MMKVAMTVSGKVQGVGFRYTTKMVADQLGVLGIVRNEDNGDVYIEAQGEEKKVNDFIEAVKNLLLHLVVLIKLLFMRQTLLKNIQSFQLLINF